PGAGGGGGAAAPSPVPCAGGAAPPARPPLDARDDERDVGDLDRDAHAGLDEVAGGVAAQVAAQVGQHARVRDLHVAVVPLTFHVDAQGGRRPLRGGGRRHQKTTPP